MVFGDGQFDGVKIWVKIGYNSGCMRDISEIRASIRGK